MINKGVGGLFFEGPDRSWQARASCMGLDPEIFYPKKGSVPLRIKKLCGSCAVRGECLDYAIENGETGYWGGTAEYERVDIINARALGATAQTGTEG